MEEPLFIKVIKYRSFSIQEKELEDEVKEVLFIKVIKRRSFSIQEKELEDEVKL